MGDSASNRRLVEGKLAAYFGLDPEEEKLTPTTAKSVLDYVKGITGINFFSAFGYTGRHARGRDKENADELLYQLESQKLARLYR